MESFNTFVPQKDYKRNLSRRRRSESSLVSSNSLHQYDEHVDEKDDDASLIYNRYRVMVENESAEVESQRHWICNVCNRMNVVKALKLRHLQKCWSCEHPYHLNTRQMSDVRTAMYSESRSRPLNSNSASETSGHFGGNLKRPMNFRKENDPLLKLNWNHIVHAMTHEMSPEMAISVMYVVTTQLNVNNTGDDAVQVVIDSLRKERSLMGKEVQMITEIVQRARLANAGIVRVYTHFLFTQ